MVEKKQQIMMLDDFIPTRGSSEKSKDLINFQSVTYETYKPKNRNKSANNPENNSTKLKDTFSDEFNIKKAKHEVVRFGMAGFDPTKKEEAKIQLAIKLGAKPLKNKYKNYKILKEERAKQREEEKSRSQFQQLGKNSAGKSLVKCKGFIHKVKKRKNEILNEYGRVKNVKKS